jgi:hypothetical protein
MPNLPIRRPHAQRVPRWRSGRALGARLPRLKSGVRRDAPSPVARRQTKFLFGKEARASDRSRPYGDAPSRPIPRLPAAAPVQELVARCPAELLDRLPSGRNSGRGVLAAAPAERADQARQEIAINPQSGAKFIAIPLMQWRRCVGGGPSSNTCPRWLPQFAQWTSVRTMPRVRSTDVLTAPSIGSSKLGQPRRANAELQQRQP